ncbi:MAG: pyruvate kinase [Mycoplasmoidaceae bacterium]|nr:MAG: pyruvate kinase [Mycoplasmoidaceae bacterium]
MNNGNKNKTKIVNTIGPAVTLKLFDRQSLASNPEKLALAKKNCEDIIKAGSSVARFNFSHGTQEEQLIRMEMLREASRKLGLPYSLLLDTKGPEIRVYKFPDDGIQYEKGQTVTIYALKKLMATKNSFCVYDNSGKYNMAKDVKVGSKVLVEDGKFILVVKKVDVKGGVVTCEAINTHVVKNNKRINLPGASYSMPFMSPKDKEDLIFACKQGMNYVAASFVNNTKDVAQLRAVLNANGGKNVKLLAKIESIDGTKNLDGIIKATDGIMVARGDLGCDLPYEEVPYWQEQMINKCRLANKPVIVATQMLDSMEKNLLPTRAEVTDVFMAGRQGTDSTMTSGETAQGSFPLNVVNTMKNINKESEYLYKYSDALKSFMLTAKYAKISSKAKKVALDIAKATYPKNETTPKASFPYEFVVMFENDEETINAVSAVRPGAAIIVILDKIELYNAFGASYGIYTQLVSNLNVAKANYKQVAKDAVKKLSEGSKKACVYIKGKIQTI